MRKRRVPRKGGGFQPWRKLWHKILKWSDSLQKSCSRCWKNFERYLTTLEYYSIKYLTQQASKSLILKVKKINWYTVGTRATSMTYVIDFEHILEYSVLTVEMYLRDMQCWVSNKLGKYNSIMHTPITKHLLLCEFTLTLKYTIVIKWSFYFISFQADKI